MRTKLTFKSDTGALPFCKEQSVRDSPVSAGAVTSRAHLGLGEQWDIFHLKPMHC